MVGFSTLPDFQVRLPAGDKPTSVLNVIVHIRDKLDSVRSWNMSSIFVIQDKETMNDLMEIFQDSPTEMNRNPFIRLLASGHQNIVGQIITIISQEPNHINMKNIYDALSSKYSLLFDHK